MCDSRIACSIASLLWASTAVAQSPPPANIQQDVDTMVRLCVAGGSTQAITGTAAGGANISVRSLDVRGNLKGDFKINKSNAEGLVNGIDNAISQLAADQADKVRDCLKPVRDRLIDVFFPIPPPPPTSRVTSMGGTWSGIVIGGGALDNKGLSVKMELTQSADTLRGRLIFTIPTDAGRYVVHDVTGTRDSLHLKELYEGAPPEPKNYWCTTGTVSLSLLPDGRLYATGTGERPGTIGCTTWQGTLSRN